MKKFKVTSGDIREFEVEAEGAEEAFIKAMDANPNASLALIYMAQEEGKPEDEDLFGAVIPLLQRLGKWEGEDPFAPDILEADIIE